MPSCSQVLDSQVMETLLKGDVGRPFALAVWSGCSESQASQEHIEVHVSIPTSNPKRRTWMPWERVALPLTDEDFRPNGTLIAAAKAAIGQADSEMTDDSFLLIHSAISKGWDYSTLCTSDKGKRKIIKLRKVAYGVSTNRSSRLWDEEVKEFEISSIGAAQMTQKLLSLGAFHTGVEITYLAEDPKQMLTILAKYAESEDLDDFYTRVVETSKDIESHA